MTKERLRNYQNLKREHQQLSEQLEKIEASLYYPKIQRITDMPTAPSKGNAMEDMTARHLELQDRYKAKMAELAAEQLAIEQAIDTLEPTARMLMRYRYIDGMTWEQVCVCMSYSWRQVHNIHAKALKQLDPTQPPPRQPEPDPCDSCPEACDGCLGYGCHWEEQ